MSTNAPLPLLQSASTFCSHKSANCLMSLLRVLQPHSLEAQKCVHDHVCTSCLPLGNCAVKVWLWGMAPVHIYYLYIYIQYKCYTCYCCGISVYIHCCWSYMIVCFFDIDTGRISISWCRGHHLLNLLDLLFQLFFQERLRKTKVLHPKLLYGMHVKSCWHY